VNAPLAGTPLTSGTIRIGLAENSSLESILGGSPSTEGGELHPLFGYIAPQRGIGTSIAALCELADFAIDDGPMLGTMELEFTGVLRPDTDYRVDGEVVDLMRKSSRRLGAFDLLTYQERLSDGSGRVVVTATTSFVLPRGFNA
jgi:hypothetical protein